MISRVFATGGREHPHSITRSDLAAFMVERLTGDAHIGTAVTVANR